MSLVTVGEIVAGVLAVAALVESRGRSLVAWGLLVLCVVLVLAREGRL